MPPEPPRHDTIPAGPPELPPVFAPGDIVAGTYEIRALLGAGGMGQVYEAHDRALNRRVAIKVMGGDFPDAAQAALLRHEGQALAAIRHPSVVAVHTLGSHRASREEGAREMPFLVMERVYGVSLEAMLEQRRGRGERLSIAEVLDLLVPIAEGLSVVHAAGVSHRDVKPANVMLAPGGRVVLMDFGLMLPDADAAHIAAREAAMRASQRPPDEAHVLEGSLEYMAPEALSPSTSARTSMSSEGAHLVDLYALGVVAFRLLTGILPYDAPDAASLARAQRHGAPDPSEHRRDVPRALSDLVRAMMAKDPADRPHSAEALLWSLRKLQGTLERTSAPAPPFSVLIVDADAAAFDSLSLFVRAVVPEAEITNAKGGEEALRIVRKRIPSVLLLDLVLADMNGVEVCMFVRGMRGGERCLILSTGAVASEADVELLDQLGVKFIPKGNDRIRAIAEAIEQVKPSIAPPSKGRGSPPSDGPRHV